MQRFFEKLRMFMYGRNGLDKLGFFTIFGYLLFNGVKICFRHFPVVYYVLQAIAVLFLVITFYRMLSKNIQKRRYESQQFEIFLARIKFDRFIFAVNKKLRRLSIRLAQIRTHRFRTCPQCKRHLRLSKKRGVRRITCPECGRKFKTFVLF